MRTPAWMVAYAGVLLLISLTYPTLVYVGRWAALVLALLALTLMLVAVALVIWR